MWSRSESSRRLFHCVTHSLIHITRKILEHSNTGTGNVKTTESQNQLTFDYLILLTVGAIIAAAGLLQDSPVTVVASMLVSPLMYVYPPKIFL